MGFVGLILEESTTATYMKGHVGNYIATSGVASIFSTQMVVLIQVWDLISRTRVVIGVVVVIDIDMLDWVRQVFVPTPARR